MAARNPNGGWLTSWRSLQALAGALLSLLAVILAVRTVDISGIIYAFHQVESWGIILAFLSVVLNNLAKAARWRIMLGRNSPSFTSILFLHLQGQLWNLVYPVRLGDLGRAFIAEQMVPMQLGVHQSKETPSVMIPESTSDQPTSAAFILGTVAFEKILDTLVYILLVVVVLVRIPLPPWLNRNSLLFAAGLAGLALFLLVSHTRFKKKNNTNAHVHGMVDGMAWYQKQASSFIRGLLQSFDVDGQTIDHVHAGGLYVWMRPLSLVLLSGFVWFTALLNNLFVLLAMGMVARHLSFVQLWDASLLLLVALVAGLNLPALPMRIGLYEYICILSLKLFGVADEPALAFGLVLHIVTMLPIIAGGLAAGFISVRSVRSVSRQSSEGFAWQGNVRSAGLQFTKFSQDNQGHNQKPVNIQKANILGVPVTAAPMDVIIQIITTWAANSGTEYFDSVPRLVGYANAHTLNSANDNPVVQQYMERADLVYADGISVTWAARFLHHISAPKMTGRMWVSPLAELASQMRLRVFLLGSQPGVADEASRKLRMRWPQFEIVGVQNGFFTALQDRVLLDKIHQAKPDILLVGMGSPRQETWILDHLDELNVPVCWVVGALFDYLAGTERPAPEWMSAVGFEWFWRLVLNPFGKWRRYLLGIPKFTLRIINQKIRIMSGN